MQPAQAGEVVSVLAGRALYSGGGSPRSQTLDQAFSAVQWHIPPPPAESGYSGWSFWPRRHHQLGPTRATCFANRDDNLVGRIARQIATEVWPKPENYFNWGLP